MNFKFILFSFLFLGFIGTDSSFAQSKAHSTYDWEKEPTLSKVSEEEAKTSGLIIKDTRFIEFVITNSAEYVIETHHKIVRVNDDKAIDFFNKVFVSMNGGAEMLEIKARAIGKDGEITVLDKNNIKEVENMGEYGNYKIFAIEGAELGGDIEYFYKLKKAARPYGKETIQGQFKIRESNFHFIHTEGFDFELHGYNNYGDFKKSADEGMVSFFTKVENIPAAIEEDYSTYRANLKKVGYKLKNYSWNAASKRYYEMIYTHASKPKMGDFIKQMKLKGLKTNLAKVIAVEKYIKENIAIKADAPSMEVNTVLSQRYADDLGLVKLYAAILKDLEIPHSVVLTGNRYQNKILKDFTDILSLSEIIIYLPEQKGYLIPNRIEYRFGPIPTNIAPNNGVFIVGPGRALVQPLPTTSVNDCVVKYTNEISFDEEMEYVTVKKFRETTGHRAYGMRANMEMITEEGRAEIMKWLFASGMEEAEILESDVKNDKMENSSDHSMPFISSATVKATSLLENAGSNYLLKVGMVIGTQSELYQETERENDIEFEYPKAYFHTIKVEIPKGYTVQNPEDAVIEHYLKNGEDVVAQFVSSYELEENVLTIKIHEYYNECQYPKDQYEGFRKVINAAADFNKVVLLLEES